MSIKGTLKSGKDGKVEKVKSREQTITISICKELKESKRQQKNYKIHYEK